MEPALAADNKARRRHDLLWGAVLVTLVLLAFWPVYLGGGAGFIWDDDEHVTGNRLLRSVGGLVKLWTDPAAFHQFYPLAQTSWWVEYQLWGAWPLGYHLTNLAIHAVSVVLLWRLLRVLRVPGAWFAAALFAVHPMQVETVAWIMERKNLLSGMFYLLAFGAFLRFFGLDDGRTGGARKWYAAGLAAFLLALLSKTVASTLPAALLLVLWWKRGRIAKRDWLAMAPLLVVGIAAGAWTGWLERHVVGANGPPWAFSPGDRFIIAGRALWHYAAKFVVPRPLIFFYPKWDLDDHAWWQYLFPLAFLGLLGMLWAGRKRWGRGPLTAMLFFTGTLVPALGFVNVYPMKYSFVADHFQYMACIGLAALAAASGAVLANKWKPWPILGAGAVILAVLALLSIERSVVFRSQLSLYSDLVAKNPGSGPGREMLATILSVQRDFSGALHQWSEARRLMPGDLNSQEGYGNALFDVGRVDEALAVLEDVRAKDPTRNKIHVDLARVYSRLGRTDEAAALYRRAIQVDPEDPAACFNYGELLARTGRFREAAEQYARAVEISPHWPEANLMLGTCLAEQGRLPEALVSFEKAAALRPGWPTAERAVQMARQELAQARGGAK